VAWAEWAGWISDPTDPIEQQPRARPRLRPFFVQRAHDPEKLSDFSDKIMRKNKKT
jgi:hypothetical protein